MPKTTVTIRRSQRFIFFEPKRADCGSRALDTIKRHLKTVENLTSLQVVKDEDYFIVATSKIDPSSSEFNDLLTEAMTRIMAVLGPEVHFVGGDDVPAEPVDDFNGQSEEDRKAAIKQYKEGLPDKAKIGLTKAA